VGLAQKMYAVTTQVSIQPLVLRSALTFHFLEPRKARTHRGRIQKETWGMGPKAGVDITL
jgi:hypothetical protein